MTNRRRNEALLGALAFGLTLVVAPGAARACGGGRASAGASPGSGGGNGSGGNGGGNSFGDGGQAYRGGRGYTGDVASASPCASRGRAGTLIAPEVGGALRVLGSMLELGAGFAWESVDVGSLRWTGWNGHPQLGEQFSYAPEAEGEALGFRRATMMGPTARLTLLLGGIVTLGVSGSYLAQTNDNEMAYGSTRGFTPGRLRALEGGGELGAIGLLGPITLRGTVFAGARRLEADVAGLGFAGCDSVPVVTNVRPVIMPRAQINASITRNVSLGVYVGLDATRPQDWGGGVMLSVHGGGFAAVTPELAAQ